MKSEHLRKYPSLTIVSGGTSVIAHLDYSVTEHKYIATLPASGLFAAVPDQQIELTADLVGQIVCQPDGTISLNLQRLP